LDTSSVLLARLARLGQQQQLGAEHQTIFLLPVALVVPLPKTNRKPSLYKKIHKLELNDCLKKIIFTVPYNIFGN